MSDSSSISATCTWNLWWPVEVVPLQVEVVEPRKLTALEWALLRVMDEFRDDPPPLAEVAEELGLDDPGFLRDTLRTVVRLRALAPREDRSAELSDLTFTELGEQLYKRGQIEAEPSTHGVTFYVDALTDEDLPEPPGHQQWAPTRFLEDQLDTVRETLGLDRVRSAMRRLHADVLKGDAEVRATRSFVEAPAIGYPSMRWRPVQVRLHVSPDGDLSVEPEGLTKKAREFLASRDLDEDGVLPSHPVSDEWGETNPPRCSTGVAFSTWRRRVGELIPSATVEARARKLLTEAKTEIVVHACWGGVTGLEEDLRAATGRGVRVLVVGAQYTSIFAWEGRTGIGLQVEVEQPVTGALVVDGTRGVLIDDVKVKLAGRTVVMELAGALRDNAAAACRAELVAGALDALPGSPAVVVPEPSLDRVAIDAVDAKVNALLVDDRVRIALSRVAFAPEEAQGTALVRLAASLAPGVERVPLMRSLGGAVRALAPSLSASVVEQAWVAAWNGVVAACLRVPSPPAGLVERLATWAPPSVEAETYVEFAVTAWAKRTEGVEERVNRLVAIASASDARWRVGVARGCRTWREARDEILAPEEWSEQAIKRRAVLVTRLMNQGDAREWADACLAKIPRPNSLAGVRLWADRAEPLRDLAGPRFEDRAAEVLGGLLDGRAGDPGAVLRSVGALLPAMRLATLILGAAPSTDAIVRTRQAFLQGGVKGVTDDDWIPHIERALPDWSGTFNAPEHGDDVGRFAAELAFPAAKKALAKWARQVATEIQRPARIEGVVWWLGEVAALAPALGEAVVPLAISVVREHCAALRDARKRGSPVWRDMRDAWLALGYGEAALNEVATEPGAPVNEASSKQQKKKEKKRR